MKKLNNKVALAVAISALCGSFQAQAQTFSSTKIEALYGDFDERASGKQGILTFANATGFTKGDTFVFADIADIEDRDSTDGVHMEMNGRLSLLRAFGNKPMEGFVKDVYAVGQVDIDGNKFTQKTTLQAGVGADLNVPGFRFLKVAALRRDDPTADGQSTQLQLIWNAPFTLGDQKFSFEGFADYTTEEGHIKKNLLTQPQIVWHATKHIGVGLEYQYWNNRLGINGLDEKTPQLLVRWTF